MDKIKQDFIKVLSYSQKIPAENFNVDEMFKIWRNAKEYFIDKMSGQLIYTYPEKVTFHLDEETRCNRVEEFVDWLKNNYIWIMIPNADLGALAEFVSIYRRDFFANSLSEEYTARVYLTHKPEEAVTITIPKGMKLTKAFKFFIKDKDLLTEIQNRASMILQEDKIEGYLCFSVHPLDYLSVSENNMNWRSCHALDGDFRGGNLNYMLDSSTAVVYLRSDKLDAEIPNFGPEVPWNDKKWRVLLFFDSERDMVFAGRQYPFEATCALNPWVKKVLEELFPPNYSDYRPLHWDEWDDTSLDSIQTERICVDFKSPYMILNSHQGLVPLKELIHCNPYRLFYNDLLESSIYTKPYYIQKVDRFGDFMGNRTQFYIGHDVKCPMCNEDYVTSPEWMICDDCVKKLKLGEYSDEESIYCYCTECGSIHLREDLYYISVNDLICQECFEKYFMECEKCGLAWHKREISKTAEGFLCPWCVEDLEREEYNSGEREHSETNNR